MKTLGIDLGSREVKLALMENNKICSTFKISTISFYKNYCSYKNNKIEVDLEKLNLSDILSGVSTGYGRNNTNLSLFKPINEIKAHVYGVMYQTNLKDFVLLDIGGQDVKAAKVEGGFIKDLELNEKCAASCGRYLENMANVLEIPLDEMNSFYENPVKLNSTCAVFSESELIGKIAEGTSIERLCAGVNYSMYNKMKPLLTKFMAKTLVLTGGVANNYAIKKYLSHDYENIIVPGNPQFNGAIGCCFYGSKLYSKE
ncbi:putative CoA-substrate-specific enzyme activase [Clostridium acetobutylicum]|uniref:Activator of 2-hydroxyglutaryl-CoA dehydratase (HSP70-class ATPase domain) n=1 Tax=Clostridium acetobutylicum (strain ATCC 824 / DSM 792 / JCM 1419 / IAM 19013 / LMG 5710 / NBRC 13948 / NRRL B-527 / VKM B-1787 / 2291 / W) TaxID=272562 RepID=Q97D57_CLOAB|nr:MULTISPECIES: acyl-CoA dehydratase activase [Clostridium]AAK81546.1 Activator of 2-hydroxyglutaryl-CoA dehydratase (HSP70-class ATPase domain) [Clostridium acetobutylicum ATCC 824]ADZ22667.1 Activator of 2-hydroxyglutaryl-CoA dehydratase (HSP70-class ATPase domain) [Clostridium acetobutylicum EA 2018]AEI34405.1 2-hydroxyglutaryl-CoA dehydratase activator [Clostridium acetobutylicum DSM 1731]AWV80781.1 2-hydroxyglutaryl-CoA dehydratase [Clostridium acetobutylicum]MBC2393894.1 2-hydroxyglutar